MHAKQRNRNDYGQRNGKSKNAKTQTTHLHTKKMTKEQTFSSEIQPRDAKVCDPIFKLATATQSNTQHTAVINNKHCCKRGQTEMGRFF